MVKRIIEELVRFPLKRKELLSKRVRQYVTLRAPFKSGNSYIIPENLPQWTELLRMDWLKKKIELPKHVEEFTWAADADADGANQAPEPMPEELESFLGSAAHILYFLPQIDGLAAGYVELGVPSDKTTEGMMTKEELKTTALLLRLSMVQMEFEDHVAMPKHIEIIRARAGAIGKDMEYIVTVKLPDTTVGFLSTREDRIAAIPVNTFASTMTTLIRKSKTLVVV
jgi:hypothetical protein